MKEIYTDIHIIGGGLIGLITGYCISKLNYKIVISDKKQSFINAASYNDNRTVAISEGTKNFLTEIDIWKKIEPFCEKIKKIKVVDRNYTNNILFKNKRTNSCLGYIIKNSIILEKVYEELKQHKNINFVSKSNIESLGYEKENIFSRSNNYVINSKLIIASDGKASKVRNIIKTPFFKKNYNQSALVICFSHQSDHKNTAYEFFYKNGPLAILPMHKTSKNFCSSIVWSNETYFLRELLKANDNDIKDILNIKTQNAIGDIKKIFSKKIFPLNSHINSKFFEKKLIYVGDSAHSIHPIAGQGWNLGMRDVKKLYKLSKNYSDLGLDLGSNEFCKQYNDQCYYDSYQLYQITDKLDYIFKNNSLSIKAIRALGFNILNKNKTLKNLISDFAMGI